MGAGSFLNPPGFPARKSGAFRKQCSDWDSNPGLPACDTGPSPFGLPSMEWRRRESNSPIPACKARPPPLAVLPQDERGGSRTHDGRHVAPMPHPSASRPEADTGSRTQNPRLGRPTLYRLSYACMKLKTGLEPAPGRLQGGCSATRAPPADAVDGDRTRNLPDTNGGCFPPAPRRRERGRKAVTGLDVAAEPSLESNQLPSGCEPENRHQAVHESPRHDSNVPLPGTNGVRRHLRFGGREHLAGVEPVPSVAGNHRSHHRDLRCVRCCSCS